MFFTSVEIKGFKKNVDYLSRRNRGIEHYNKQHASQGLATLLEMKIPFMLTPLWV